MTELFTWVRNTLGADIWGRDAHGLPYTRDERTARIISHYDSEIVLGKLSLTQAYERCCDDIQSRNHHVSKPQRGKAYRAVTLNLRAK